MDTLLPRKIPTDSNCPKQYCFFFIEADSYYTASIYESIDEAMSKLESANQEACHCPFGVCKRIAVTGDHDWYEPCEPRLKRDNLPINHSIKTKNRQ